MKFLLVDDETLVRAFVEPAMPQGSTLDYAQTLVDGLQLMRQQVYDLILVDLSLPGCRDGEALYETLEVCGNTAVLVITKLHSMFHGEAMISRGATWVVFKPDAAMEPELASRLLSETILFTLANHAAHQQQLAAKVDQTRALAELQREVRLLRPLQKDLEIMELRRAEQQADIQYLQSELSKMKEQLQARGHWMPLWAKIVGAIGSAVAVILPWLLSRSNKP